MNHRFPLVGFSLLAASALAACAQSEPVDSFKPDRAEEKVAVTDGSIPANTSGAPKAGVTAVLAPQDQCAKDPTFVTYRQALQAAVTAKNFDQLKPLIDPAIKLDFGGGASVEEFGKRLSEGDGSVRDSGPQWDDLAEVLTLGCALDATGMVATMPYAFANLGDRDAFATMLPRRDGINLYETADAKGKVVKKLGWDVLTMAGPANAKDAFVAVKLDDGTAGFVARTDARSALGYRALSNKGSDGKWLMTAFIAGD